MKLQAVRFKRKMFDEFEPGVAVLNGGYDISDVDYIIDTEGKKVKKIHDYRLQSGPMCYMEVRE